jgi:hypothetical protein
MIAIEGVYRLVNGFIDAETQRRRENLILRFSLRLCASASTKPLPFAGEPL